ncbi:MAG: hypothetical protein ABI592_02190 [Acidobacteriota bacterium]
MSALLERPPFGPRDDARFIEEMNALTAHHLAWCPPFARVWPGWTPGADAASLPYLHAGVFKRGDLTTEFPGVRRGRFLRSSGSGGAVSRIALDEESSALQARSAAAILADALGGGTRPLLVIDRAASLRERGTLSARTAAALSLAPLASEIRFLLDDPGPVGGIAWSRIADLLEREEEILVYGFTSILWQEWAERRRPADVAGRLARRKIVFVHSGGWKRLEAQGIDPKTLESRLLATAGPGSRVVDFYGLVEQIGVPYPLCVSGYRHVPVWADVVVRDATTLSSLAEETGMLQLVNVLARGAPNHSVLTEDLGRIAPGPCPCGREGKRFEMLGRVPRAELRGCANV